MESSHAVGDLFLKLFTKELIVNSMPEKKEEIEEKIKKIEQEPEPYIPSAIMPAANLAITPPEKIQPPQPIRTIQKTAYIKPRTIEMSSPMQKMQSFQPRLFSMSRQIQQTQQRANTLPQVSQFIVHPEFKTQANIDLGKLNFFIQNPKLTSLECSGPEKFLIIKDSGMSKTTNISMNSEEISEIITKFSQATKIPVTEGIFKAALGNLTITAIISEIAGSRFIINKHNIQPSFQPGFQPFQQFQPGFQMPR